MQDDPISIADLLPRAVAGEAAALQALLARYREFVRLLVRSRCGGQLRKRLDSSDLIQETLLQAARHIHQFHGRGEEEWRAWLGRIAEREVIRQLRRHLGAERRAVQREQEPGADSGGSRLGQWFRTHSSPSAAAMRHERALQLTTVLGKLPEDYREVLILRHLEGLPFQEIAERLGRSAGAVRVLWTRALQKLREEWARHESLADRREQSP